MDFRKSSVEVIHIFTNQMKKREKLHGAIEEKNRTGNQRNMYRSKKRIIYTFLPEWTPTDVGLAKVFMTRRLFD